MLKGPPRVSASMSCPAADDLLVLSFTAVCVDVVAGFRREGTIVELTGS
jgi:hypothetical protein